MPNWCYTNMYVYGSKEECLRFRDGVLVKEDEENIYDYHKNPIEIIGTKKVKRLRIINAFFPCPEELYEVKSPVREEQKERSEEMLAKYGATDWYAWQNTNWGTKWGDCETELEGEHETDDGKYSLNYRFETAWGTATQAFQRISEQFPTLIFEFSHTEEAGFFQGNEIIQNGEVLYEMFFAPCEYSVPYPDDPEKEDEWNEKESEWRGQQQYLIDIAADAILAELKKQED